MISPETMLKHTEQVLCPTHKPPTLSAKNLFLPFNKPVIFQS